MITKSEKGYLAGIIDGEGEVAIRKQVAKQRYHPYYSFSIRIGNTNKNLLLWIKNKLNCGWIRERKQKNPNSKLYYEICFFGKNAENLVKLVFPFLIIKKKQAKLGLILRKTIQQKSRVILPNEILKIREELYNKARILNQRGVNLGNQT